MAILVILAATLLFVDVSGVAHLWLGWVAKIQLLPAILALNLGVVVVLVVGLGCENLQCSQLMEQMGCSIEDMERELALRHK